jgi:hypothetical protein
MRRGRLMRWATTPAANLKAPPCCGPCSRTRHERSQFRNATCAASLPSLTRILGATPTASAKRTGGNRIGFCDRYREGDFFDEFGSTKFSRVARGI